VTANHLSDFFKAKREQGLSENTRQGMKSPLARIFKHAIRRGYVSRSPLSQLESDELPKAQNKRASRVLNRDELGKLLAHAPKTYKPVIATAALTGMRLMELLGLTWADVDFEANAIRVRFQLSRATKENPAKRVPLKTKAGSRDIRMEPDLKALLLRLKMASRFKTDSDYVFSTQAGTPFNYRNVCVRGLEKAAEDAGLNVEGKASLVMHDLRHTYGSHLVQQGLDPVRVSRQMGHARPSITLDVYAKEFEQAQHADDVADKLTAAFGGVL
jgi:integrase